MNFRLTIAVGQPFQRTPAGVATNFEIEALLADSFITTVNRYAIIVLTYVPLLYVASVGLEWLAAAASASWR